MAHRLMVYCRFVMRYAGANLQGALEYRLSFASQVVAMFINDAVWLTFWLAYFSSFPLVAGWGRDEIITLWAVVAVAFGVGNSLFGGAARLAGAIIRGELDVYLSLPKPPLLHAMVSRMDVTAPGDVLFGLGVYILLLRPGPVDLLLFGIFALTGAAIFVCFAVITQSLAFWLGNAEGLGQQLMNALLMFSTYPTVIFQGIVKAALFTVIPAGFVAYIPVQVLRSFSWPLFAGLLLFTVAIVGVTVLVFRAGLRRYESGNLVLMRE